MLKPIWWRSWLEEAVKKEPGDFELNKAKEMAYCWDACAIGEKRESLEIRGVQFPCDNNPGHCYPNQGELLKLGNIFFVAIVGRNFPLALSILDQTDKWIEEHPVVLESDKIEIEEEQEVRR